MGLNDAIDSEGGGTLVDIKSKFCNPEKCVACGSTNTEQRDHDWRCHNPDCSLLTYYNSPKVRE